MLNLKQKSNNEPILTYEIVVDLGTNGTKAVYVSNTLSEIYKVIDSIRMGALGINALDLDIDELKLIETIGINIVLIAKDIDFVKYDYYQSAKSLVKLFKIV